MNTPRRSISRKISYEEIDNTLEEIEDNPSSSDSEILITAKSKDCKNIPLKQLSIVLEKIDFNANSDSDESRQPRRGTRLRKKPKTYLDSAYVENPSHKQRQSTAQDNITDTSDDEYDTNMDSPKKPTALFTNEDVEGQEMFGFKASATHGKAHMAKKAKESGSVHNSPATPSGLRTPHKLLSKRLLQNVDNTPKHVNAIIKKRITKQIEIEQGESDFSASSSDDYCPDEDSSSTDGQQDDEENASASEPEVSEEEVPKRNVKFATKSAMKCATPGRKARSKKDDEYFVHSEDYFMMHGSKKNATSDHTLERLKNLQLMDSKTTEPIEFSSISDHHKSCIRELNEIHKSMFDKWLYVLGEDYNILLYGVGSKRKILESFQEEKLGESPCIVVNGFFPSLTIRSIVESILTDLLEVRHVPGNPLEAVPIIDQQLSYHNVELFVLVHNLDGAMLRNNKAQKFLSELARIKRVHMLATIDHINAPLICDHSKLSNYKFSWWDATSLLPYTAETSYETSLMVQGSGALALSSLRSVYRSLTTNAKGIYLILVQKQLENIKTSHYQGLPFKDLYSLCREAFLVSSDIALRAQLTEFLDHKLVKMKRSIDGIENLLVPIDSVLLQQFLDHQESQ